MHDYDELQKYIESYWSKLKITDTHESKTSLGLPHPYYVPSVEVVDGFVFRHMYYWDSFFTVQGLWGTERESDTIDMAENMFDLIRRLGFVPNSNGFSLLSRSQPPLLTSLVMQIAERTHKADDFDWLELAYARTSEELKTVWFGVEQPHIRLVHKGLSRYYDANVLDVLAEAESGWDYTTRFEDSALDFLPIDLNALLYKYEVDLSILARRLGRTKDSKIWAKFAAKRRRRVDQLMWDKNDGLYYDYDYRSQRQGGVKSLATYVPMFAGMCSEKKAARLVENLHLFETEYGLTTTSIGATTSADKQWVAPNGWAPLHYLVVDGLRRYGYIDDAKRIAKKWVDTVNMKFHETGHIEEKYNVQDPWNEAGGSVYPHQVGFGWTNGVTIDFIRFLSQE